MLKHVHQRFTRRDIQPPLTNAKSSSLNNKEEGDNEPIHVLLHGPSRDGKTSLAFDQAYNISSSMPKSTSGLSSSIKEDNIFCPICNLKFFRNPPSKSVSRCSFATNDYHNNNKHVCQCCAVAFIMPLHKRSHTNFALRCSPWNDDDNNMSGFNNESSEDVRIKTTFQSKMNKIEREELNIIIDDKKDIRRSQIWEDWILKRIKIKYVESSLELIHFLASIQAMPSNSRPWGGIVIDDLDYFIDGYDEPDNGTIQNNRNDLVQRRNGSSFSNPYYSNEAEGETGAEIESIAIPENIKPKVTTAVVMKLIQILYILTAFLVVDKLVALARDTCEFLGIQESDFGVEKNLDCKRKSGIDLVVCLNSDFCQLSKSLASTIQMHIPYIATISQGANTCPPKSIKKNRYCPVISNWDISFSKEQYPSLIKHHNHHVNCNSSGDNKDILASYDLVIINKDSKYNGDSKYKNQNIHFECMKEIKWKIN